MAVKIPVYCTQWGKDRDWEHLGYFCTARSVPSPAVFSASTELPPQAALVSSPASRLQYHPVFSCEGSPRPLLPLLPWNWLFYWHHFLLPSHFSWPLYTRRPHNPSRFLFLRFSSFVFLSIIFPGLIFSMLFSSFLVFRAGLLIVFSCAFLSYPHIRTICCPSHLLSFLPWPEIYFLFFPEKYLKWKENTLRPLPLCSLSSRLVVFFFPPLSCFLSRQGLVASGLFIAFNILNGAHNSS